MFRKALVFIFLILGISSVAYSSEDRTYGFQIPNSKGEINNILGAIPILGDVTTAKDIDEKTFIVKIKDGYVFIHIDGKVFELGKTANKYQFKYLNKNIDLDIVEQKIISSSTLNQDEKPKSYDLVLLFDSNNYTARINTLESELEETSALASEQASIIEISNDKILTLEDDTASIEELENDLIEKTKVINTLETRISGLNDNIAALQNQLSETNKIIGNQNVQISEAGATINLLTQTASEITDLQKVIQERDRQVLDLSSTVEILKREISTLEIDLYEANTIITDQINQLSETIADEDAGKAALNAATLRTESLEKMIAKRDDQLSYMETTISTLKAEILDINTQLTQARDSLNAMYKLNGQTQPVNN